MAIVGVVVMVIMVAAVAVPIINGVNVVTKEVEEDVTFGTNAINSETDTYTTVLGTISGGTFTESSSGTYYQIPYEVLTSLETPLYVEESVYVSSLADPEQYISKSNGSSMTDVGVNVTFTTYAQGGYQLAFSDIQPGASIVIEKEYSTTPAITNSGDSYYFSDSDSLQYVVDGSSLSIGGESVSTSATVYDNAMGLIYSYVWRAGGNTIQNGTTTGGYNNISSVFVPINLVAFEHDDGGMVLGSEGSYSSSNTTLYAVGSYSDRRVIADIHELCTFDGDDGIYHVTDVPETFTYNYNTYTTLGIIVPVSITGSDSTITNDLADLKTSIVTTNERGSIQDGEFTASESGDMLRIPTRLLSGYTYYVASGATYYVTSASGDTMLALTAPDTSGASTSVAPVFSTNSEDSNVYDLTSQSESEDGYIIIPYVCQYTVTKTVTEPGNDLIAIIPILIVIALVVFAAVTVFGREY